MERYKRIFKEKTMAEWKKDSLYYVYNTPWYGKLLGNNGWYLTVSSSKGDIIKFQLNVKGLNVKEVKDDDFDLSQHYFYKKVYVNPDIYNIISQSIGGAIVVKAQGRWSGSAEDFSKDINIPMVDLSVNGIGGYAISKKDAIKIIKQNFKGLVFKPGKDYGFIVDFSKV